MNRSSRAALAAAIVASLAGCAGLPFGNRVIGPVSLYADTHANEHVTENAVAQKSGEACASSVLGIINTGDASVATAARTGGIVKVTSVDNRYKNILGVYATYCVVVTGE